MSDPSRRPVAVGPHDTADHWNHVFSTKATDEVSWFQPEATTSLRLLQGAPGSVIDVGAGTSTLVDGLLAAGRADITVLDVSRAALEVTRRRLGGHSHEVSYVVADLLAWEPARTFDAWHDRAVFHFLTDPGEQSRYVDLVTRTVAPGGVVVLGAFAADGPTHCSGLPTARYSAGMLTALFEPHFTVEHTEREAHTTPTGPQQWFTWARFSRAAPSGA